MMKLGYFTDSKCLLHNMGHEHPEQPGRLSVIDNELKKIGLSADLYLGKIRSILREEIELVHSKKLVDKILKKGSEVKRGYFSHVDSDTLLSVNSLKSIYMSAGSGCSAIDLMMERKISRAFCATRPPGHHAERNISMGFCFFNNIAIAAEYAMKIHKLKRIAIIDFDVHHGNGTVDIFQNNPNVLVCSSFQHPYYPHRHTNTEGQNLVHLPLATGSGSTTFRKKIEQSFFPSIDAFKPQMILISAGFDAHRDDPLGELNLGEEDFRWITRHLVSLSKQHCNDRVLSMLEGGYNLHSLAKSVVVHLEELQSG